MHDVVVLARAPVTELRQAVVFARHNVIKDAPFTRIDFVSCRNMLIYLERDMQRQLLALFHYALNTGAYLFLGSAESVDTRPELLSGLDEARMSFLGATSDLDAARGPFLVFDLGGGSTEFVYGTDDIEASISVDVGCVRMDDLDHQVAHKAGVRNVAKAPQRAPQT